MRNQLGKNDMHKDPTQYHEERLFVLETLVTQINKNLEKIDQRFEKIDERFDKIDQRFEKMDEKMDQRFEKMDRRFETMDKDIRHGLDKINDRLWSNFLWLIGIMLATSGGLFSLMAHGFHWI